MSRHRAFYALLALGLVSSPAAAFCPSYTASSSSNSNNCGVEAAPGTNPSPTAWQDIFHLVAQGPSVWGAAGPAVGDIGQGCGKPEPSHNVAARFPCEILKAIAMQESGWRQFCAPDEPGDQVGKSSRTIIAFDCGYGIGQVTSGMHNGENPAFDRAQVAADPTYNLATGTQILAEKWKATNCVGDNQPTVVEDWYTAVWAYNGLAYSNNPNNPNHDPNRGVWDPNVGGSYTYQERVFGWVEHPPAADYWPSVALAYPDRKDVGTSGSPPNLPEPSCASPTDCGSTRSVHASACFGAGGAAGAGGSGNAGQMGVGGSTAGTGAAGTGTAGTGTAGTGTAGSGTAGKGTAGSGTAGKGTAGAGAAGKGAAGTGGKSGAGTSLGGTTAAAGAGATTGLGGGGKDAGAGGVGAKAATAGAGGGKGLAEAPAGAESTGCGCRTASAESGVGLWVGLALAGIAAHRRRVRRARA